MKKTRPAPPSKKLNFKAIAEYCALLEGGKKEVNITQIREILSLLSYLLVIRPEVITVLVNNGLKLQGKWK